jgi:4-hydroxybenzoate polyprenyltransferase
MILASFYIIRYTLFEILIQDTYLEFPLNGLNFFLLAFSTAIIAAAGNIINDIKDVESDAANKKTRRIVKHKISINNAYRYYVALNIIGLLMALYLTINIQAFYLFFIHLISAFLLYFYSPNLKCSGILGNLTIAFLTAMVPLIVLIYFLAVGDSPFIDKIQQFDLLFILIAYAVFSFLINLVREIAKDVEDKKGDKRYNCRTIAVRWSVRRIKKLLLIIIAAAILSIVFLGLVFINTKYYVYATAILIIPAIMIIDLVPTTLTAKSRKDFNHISKSTKVVLTLGLIFLGLLFFV